MNCSRGSLLTSRSIIKLNHKFLNTIITENRVLLQIPSTKGIPIFGTLLSLLAAGGPENLHRYIDDRHKQLGPIFKEQLGPISSIFVNDTAMIRDVLANEGKYPKHVVPESWILYNTLNTNPRGLYFMDGEEWYKCRRSLNRILLKDSKFNIDKLETSGILEKQINSWIPDKNGSEVINLEENLYILSITFMMFYIMGPAFIENQQVFDAQIRKLAVAVRQIFECSVKLSSIPAKLAQKLNFNVWKRFVYAINESINISSDLLENMHKCQPTDGLLKDMIDQNIPFELIRRIIIDFIIAAGDTTATATQWALYLLSKHPEIQENSYIELKNDCNDRSLKNILRETMRLYPIAPFITRYLPYDVNIGSYRIQSGELISFSMYSCGRSEHNFPNPNTFNPDRWIRGKSTPLSSSSSKFLAVNDVHGCLPYAKGARSCIGQKLSDVQLTAVLKKIILMYQLQVKNTVDVKLNLICVPSEPIRLYLKSRRLESA